MRTEVDNYFTEGFDEDECHRKLVRYLKGVTGVVSVSHSITIRSSNCYERCYLSAIIVKEV